MATPQNEEQKKRSWIIPSITSWMSAGMLYLFLAGWGIGAASVIPYLLELGEKSIRLAALGWLGLFLSPILIVALGNHVLHGVMDHFDTHKGSGGLLPGVEALWAGCFAWLAMVLSTVTAALVTVAVFPPPPEEGAVHAMVRIAVDVRIQASVHTFVWIATSALLYSIERSARKTSS